MAAALELLASSKMFGGVVRQFTHLSEATATAMRFSVFVPETARTKSRAPVLYYLSGLTCTDENFTQKAGAQQFAARHGIMLVAPDTSPRGTDLPGEHDSYDFGSGAGFYVDATESPWNQNYNMFSYVTEELPQVIAANFAEEAEAENCSIFGHSMGGHGALISALRCPGKYASVSAFAPISNPVECAWGKKAFSGYLGDSDDDAWKAYDATHLVGKYDGPVLPVMIDVGDADNFYEEGQLLPENFQGACEARGDEVVDLHFNVQPGYDHSYNFIASFVEKHIEFHSKYLLQ